MDLTVANHFCVLRVENNHSFVIMKTLESCVYFFTILTQWRFIPNNCLVCFQHKQLESFNAENDKSNVLNKN